ncbi:dihydrofolate reductase [bacterium]|jgi:dihydrofolate reductase|nr:dihydrofolate reductase [bacterium]
MNEFLKKFSIFVSISNNNKINNNILLWDFKEILNIFEKLTNNKIVIMDKDFFLSIKSIPLKNRINIIICGQDFDYINRKENILTSNTGIIKVKDMNDVIEFTKKFEDSKTENHEVSTKFNTNEFFIIGNNYDTFLPYINKIYMTKTISDIENGEEFTDISGYNWKLLKNNEYKNEYFNYSFLEIEKI